MNITGKDLEMVQHGLRVAIGEIQNQIHTCPDPIGFHDKLQELYDEMGEFEVLLERVTDCI